MDKAGIRRDSAVLRNQLVRVRPAVGSATQRPLGLEHKDSAPSHQQSQCEAMGAAVVKSVAPTARRNWVRGGYLDTVEVQCSKPACTVVRDSSPTIGAFLKFWIHGNQTMLDPPDGPSGIENFADIEAAVEVRWLKSLV